MSFSLDIHILLPVEVSVLRLQSYAAVRWPEEDIHVRCFREEAPGNRAIVGAGGSVKNGFFAGERPSLLIALDCR